MVIFVIFGDNRICSDILICQRNIILRVDTTHALFIGIFQTFYSKILLHSFFKKNRIHLLQICESQLIKFNRRLNSKHFRKSKLVFRHKFFINNTLGKVKEKSVFAIFNKCFTAACTFSVEKFFQLNKMCCVSHRHKNILLPIFRNNHF